MTEGIGPLEDGTEFRRARLYVEGLLHKHVKFKAQYDFAGGEAGFKDMYIGLTKLPGVGNITFGHQKEPLGLEVQTSSKYITFLERSLSSTFAPERNTGIMFQNAVAGDKMTWAFGAFRNADGFGACFGNGGYNYTGRITGRPWYEDKGRKVLHLGLAYRHGNPNGNRLRYRARPSAHLLPRFVDTRSFSATSSDTIGTEFAVVNGPASIQSEFIYSSVDRPTGQRENFTSVLRARQLLPHGRTPRLQEFGGRIRSCQTSPLFPTRRRRRKRRLGDRGAVCADQLERHL